MLQNLNLLISIGKFFCLLGQNYSGKTTTINLILGFANASLCSVEINEIKLESTQNATKNMVVYIPEVVQLYAYQSAAENLVFFGHLAGLKNTKTQLQGLSIKDESLKTKLTTPNIRLALSPRLQLNVFYHYNSANERSRWNSRLSWEYQPQSFVYLVFNENKTNDFRQDKTIVKISFLKQF